MIPWIAIACDHSTETMLIVSIDKTKELCLASIPPEQKIFEHRAFRMDETISQQLDAWFIELGFNADDRKKMIRGFGQKIYEAGTRSAKDAHRNN